MKVQDSSGHISILLAAGSPCVKEAVSAFCVIRSQLKMRVSLSQVGQLHMAGMEGAGVGFLSRMDVALL